MGQRSKPYLNPHYLQGQILMAMPGMSDPRFKKAVIYLCCHDEYGAMGLVLNHVLPGLQFGSLLKQMDIASDITLPSTVDALPVINGGPVETSRGFLLHSKDFMHDDTVRIHQDICLTGTVDALKEIASGTKPENMIFTLGYAGWSPGQLDQEMQNNAWLSCPAKPEIIFESTPDAMWQKAIDALRFDPSLLSSQAGRA